MLGTPLKEHQQAEHRALCKDLRTDVPDDAIGTSQLVQRQIWSSKFARGIIFR